MRKIGKYTVTRKLGAGGMGVVYAAHDPTANRAVAVKVLADDEADSTDLRRFEREAWAAAQVKHPNTVAVLDAGHDDGKPFLVMELVDGQTVGQLVDRRGPLPWALAAKIISSACKGLDAVHAAGLVHRDVKPGNVMISADGVVKLADFGLAKMANRTTRSLTGAGTVGTPHFMSPEQCHNEPVDGRADIYALGATFYVLLTNATPYTGDHELQVMYAHCNEPVPDPRAVVPDLPPGCSQVVRRAMAKTPGERYQTAAAMQAALEGLIARDGADADETAELSTLKLPPETMPSGSVVPRSWLRDGRVTRRRLLLGVPAAGLIGATAAVAWPYFRNKVEAITQEPDPPAVVVPKRDVGGKVEDLAVSGSGRWLGVAAGDGVKLFDRSKGDANEEWWGWRGERVGAVAVSVDGSVLAAAVGGVLRAVRPRDRKPIDFGNADLGGTVTGLAFSPDGRFLAAAIEPAREEDKPPLPSFVRLWDTRKRAFVRDLRESRKETIGGVSFAADNTTLAVEWRMNDTAFGPAVVVWNADSAKVIESSVVVANDTRGPFAAFARSALRLVVACGDRFHTFDPPQYDVPPLLPPLPDKVSAAALSADGTVVALAFPHAIYFFRPDAGNAFRVLKDTIPLVTIALAFADDDRTVIGGCGDKQVYEWAVPGA